MTWELPLGANIVEDGVRFRVWVPAAQQQVEVVFFDKDEREIGVRALERDDAGFFNGLISGVGKGTRYMYRLDGDKTRSDPVSRYLPLGVHKASEVVNPNEFKWTDTNWNGVAPDQAVIYEIHVGTFTAGGTFTGVISKLDYLRELGVTALELMPVADFPGNRNWGYDGVALYAPARCYGYPHDLRRLVNEAHARGLAVIQDVVYNHLGPEGNYLRDFSPNYFTDKHKTPWGDALNFDLPEVREYFINNALYWAHEFHVDGLRLDATHAILDESMPHILTELRQRVQDSLPPERHFLIYAEDERNDNRLIRLAQDDQGFGLDGVWADDFHHEVRVAFAKDREGYYQDYQGNVEELVATLNQGWFYQGQSSSFAGKSRGGPAGQLSPSHYLHCIQNHDQIGNRAVGDRLNHNISLAAYRAASALLLCSPYTPLLFMGQEWAAGTPWQFFTNFESDMGKAVTEGRLKEFAGFSAFTGQEVPNPEDVRTFEHSQLKWSEHERMPHAQILALYQDLLALRRESSIFQERTRANYKAVKLGEKLLGLRLCNHENTEKASLDLLLVVNLEGQNNLNLLEMAETKPSAKDGAVWQICLHTEAEKYGGNSGNLSYDPKSGLLELKEASAVLLQLAPLHSLTR